MDQKSVDALVSIGECVIQNKQVQKGIKTTLKGTAGLGAIGVGTALETVGAGTVAGTFGYAITGAGCAATQALMTGAATVLPGAVGTAVSGAIGSAATAIFTVASCPAVLGGVAILGAISLIGALLDE